MEALYKKLYDKYTTLKTNKLSELDKINKEQEEKFLNYLSAAEELIEHLKSENDELHGQVNDLRNELASVRLAKDKQVADYQSLLMEESKKNEALFEEVAKLQKQLKEGTSGDLNNNSKVMNKDDQFKDTSNCSSVRMTRKRMRQVALEKEARFISCENDEGNSVERESTQNFHKETAPDMLQECCTTANGQSGVDLQESGHRDWLIQALFEYTLDMKLSTDYQTGRLCLSAVHESSGYSFSLSWISKAPAEEAELLYHVLSLGTLERLAPEWMREDIMFSPTMCPVFFEREKKIRIEETKSLLVPNDHRHIYSKTTHCFSLPRRRSSLHAVAEREREREMGSSSPSPDIYIPEQWSEAAESIAYSSMPPITLICGAKNCGKTTFSRYLLNILLGTYNRVAYLDTDVGQPEFTPPGFVSLTIVHKATPDLTIPCLKTPERCLFFGDVSSKRDPSAYLNYVFSIYDYYRKEYCTFDKGENPPRTELPLIVNTPGWVKGVGYDVLVDMLKYICPTHVVKINISTENKNLPTGEFWLDGEHDGTLNLIEINSARQDSLNRSVLVQKDARLLHDLRIMAYFRQCFPSDSDISTIKELAHSLASHCPYEVPIASIKIQHLHREVPSSEIFYSLNASIVGLAVDSEGPENLPWSLGLGIVRGIDTAKSVLYVITPVPHSSLEKVNLLLQGYIQIPTCLLQVQECISPYMSANVLTTS